MSCVGRYRELVELASARRRKLVETKKLFEFHREVEDVETWIVEKTAVAGSEDYGTDIEHVQVQICYHFIIRSKVYGYSSSQSNLPHRYRNSHAI